MIELIIFFGALSGVICAIIADSKNRNVVGWFFLGFIFGILAIIAIVLSEKEEGKPNDRLPWKCPKCGHVNSYWAQVCQNRIITYNPNSNTQCGEPNPSAIMEMEKKCPMCAEMVKSEAKICRFCNHAFKE